MITPLQLWHQAMPVGKTMSSPPTAITFNPSPRSQPTSPRLDEQEMLVKTQGQFASQSKDLHRCREELKLAQAEIRGLRRQLATMPSLVRGPDGERWPISEEEVGQLKGQVLELTKQLEQRPSYQAYEALQLEVSDLRAQLHNQYSCDQLLSVVESLKAELDIRPTTKAYDAVWADVERLRDELNKRPTQAMLDQAQQQADHQRQRAEEHFSQKVAAESELASLRALLREEQRKSENLVRRNGVLSSDLASTKARQAAEGARWTNEILYARQTERQLVGSLHSAREEISKLSPANTPVMQSRPIMSAAGNSPTVFASRSLRVPTSTGSTTTSTGPAARSSPFLLSPRTAPKPSLETPRQEPPPSSVAPATASASAPGPSPVQPPAPVAIPAQAQAPAHQAQAAQAQGLAQGLAQVLNPGSGPIQHGPATVDATVSATASAVPITNSNLKLNLKAVSPRVAAPEGWLPKWPVMMQGETSASGTWSTSGLTPRPVY